MVILSLIGRARAAGLTLEVRDGRLDIRGPRSAAALAEGLGQRKAEVIAALSAPPPEGRPTTGDRPEPDPAPWRQQVAGWPAPWREAWRIRMVELQARGFTGIEIETRAHAELDWLRRFGRLPAEAEASAEAILEALAAAEQTDTEEEAPRRPSVAELLTWRWGPGLDDPTPGIQNDHPDPNRAARALEAAASSPDDYAIEERIAIQREGDFDGIVS